MQLGIKPSEFIEMDEREKAFIIAAINVRLKAEEKAREKAKRKGK